MSVLFISLEWYCYYIPHSSATFMSYFDGGSNFFASHAAHEGTGATLDVDPVDFACSIPVPSFTHTTRAPIRKSSYSNIARAKWGPVTFRDDEAVRFRTELTDKIVELRKDLSTANTTVTFPEHVPTEATTYFRPEHGSKWEMFDLKKHADPQALQSLQAKKRDALERLMYQRRVAQGDTAVEYETLARELDPHAAPPPPKLGSLREYDAVAVPGRANASKWSMSWGEVLSSDL